MYKVMIVDDEPLFRNYMQTKFDWKEQGLVVCCEAKHGLDALEQAEAFRPDIALVDINMPYMDGLQLSEQLKLRYPDMSIVLVTGHNEFEYARKAIRMGVQDYLLKPFNKEEFVVTLHKVKSFIQAAQEEKDKSRDHSAILRESFLNHLISQDFNMNREDIEASMERFRIPVPPKHFRVAVTEIDNLYESWSDPAEIALWKHTIANMLRDLVAIDGEHLLFHDAEGRTVSILAFNKEEERASFSGQAYRRLCQLVERHFKFTVTVGLGRPFDEYKDLRFSYRDALTAIQNKMSAGQGSVIGYEEMNSSPNKFDFFPVELHENLIYSLRLKDWDGVEEQLALAFAYLDKTKATVDNAFTGLMGLISLCLSFAIESGHSIAELFGSEFSPYQELRRMATIEQCREWITGLYRCVVDSSSGHRQSKSLKLYDAARQFIQARYADHSLTVEGIAGHLYIESSYLRKIFKKEGDMSVSDYLTYIRMQKAKELIIGSGQLKLIGVAEQTGYSDANYFSKCFKKHFGVTPTEYEMMKRN